MTIFINKNHSNAIKNVPTLELTAQNLLKNFKDLFSPEIGQEVYVRTPPTLSKEADKWKRASVIDIHNSRTYDISTEGGIVRRNRSWLIEASMIKRKMERKME